MHTLTEQAAAVRAWNVSPLELVQASLESIERTQPETNAWTHVFADEALARAKELQDAEAIGPLHGVPIAVKDLYDIAGVVTSGCCAAYLERTATDDSPVVAKLKAAGAIIVGKTNMHELAFGPTSQLSCYGPVRNPWDTTKIPGGSSGGSGAAVASRTVLMGMGSDTGGSIRIPASLCGTSGLKPTHGAVSLRGAMPMTASFDTGGPLAVSAEDCITVHRVIAGFDTDYPYSRQGTQVAIKPLKQLRIGVLANWLSEATDDVQKAIAGSIDVFKGLGATLIETEGLVPTGMRGELGAVLMSEFADHYRDLWDNPLVGQNTHAMMDGGRSFQAIDYARGRELALRTHMTFMKGFEDFDLLLSPAQPDTAPPRDNSDPLRDAVTLTLFTMPVNAAGLPAVVFPVNSDGLPMSAQLIGPPWSEELLCATAAAYQSETAHHLRAAPIG
jgi:aspartyl-tRNA(Asn)/glutamyl-tRNA(Gln) amidotransferase subunit A